MTADSGEIPITHHRHREENMLKNAGEFSYSSSVQVDDSRR